MSKKDCILPSLASPAHDAGVQKGWGKRGQGDAGYLTFVLFVIIIIIMMLMDVKTSIGGGGGRETKS